VQAGCVPEDASLDEFLDAGGDSDGDDDRGGDATAEGTADADPLDDVAPATATATWRPDGAACAACGSVVERRWRDGDDLVCGDCKEW